ncbi:MAG: hypothetical protein HKN57_07295 [Xanthomonadales bacterium]|nr:hypothetical protein [Gammaproteobacteria bacterium]MBT8055043.1 hypothetical protein [Gammaproteobacteria bacterium]NND57040.1 hypothetical protein [Xanthomonadales bacterium]
MDEKYTNENMLIERYLEGALSIEEQQAFEEQFLSSGELLDQLEAAERLQQGMHDVMAVQKAHIPEKATSRVAAFMRTPHYAIAASILVLFAVGLSGALMQENARLTEINTDRVVPTEIIPLVTVRSASDSGLNTLVLGDSARQFVMMLDPGFESFSHYRATVYQLKRTGKPAMLWQVDEMLPGYEDMLALAVPSSFLEPGDYQIQLEGWQDEWPTDHGFEPIDTKSFKITK